MTVSPSRTVAPVSAVCAAFTAQPSAYPPRAIKPDVAPPCRNVAKAASTEKIACGRFSAEEEAASGKAAGYGFVKG